MKEGAGSRKDNMRFIFHLGFSVARGAVRASPTGRALTYHTLREAPPQRLQQAFLQLHNILRPGSSVKFKGYEVGTYAVAYIAIFEVLITVVRPSWDVRYLIFNHAGFSICLLSPRFRLLTLLRSTLTFDFLRCRAESRRVVRGDQKRLRLPPRSIRLTANPHSKT